MTTLLNAAVLCAAAVAAHAQVAPGVSIAISNEVVPAGGVAQIKVGLTEPKPIVRTSLYESFDEGFFDSILGIAGGAGLTGIAQYSNGRLRVELSNISATTPERDYPVLTMAVRTRQTLAPGLSTPVVLDLGRSTWISPDGLPYGEEAKPGSVSIGGTLFISDVLPGGGTIAAGGRFRVLGGGFTPRLRARAEGARLVSVSPTEFVMEAKQPIQLDGLRITADLDRERVIYYSYPRATKAAPSTNPALNGAVPVFSTGAALVASTALSTQTGTVNAIGIQNPTGRPAELRLTAVSVFGTMLATARIGLNAREVVFRTVEELFGATLPVGSAYLVVTGNSAFQFTAGHISADGGSIVVPPVLTLLSAGY